MFEEAVELAFYCRKRKDLVVINDNIVFMLLAAMCLTACCFDLAVEFAKGLATLRECNVKVEAVLRYIDKVDSPNDRYKHYMYYPVFTYEYEGINYTSSSQRKLYFLEKRRYFNHESERFMIRINGENPRQCVQGSILEPVGFFLISMAFMTWFFMQGKLL